MIQVEERQLADIPCIVMRDSERGGEQPLLIHYHGWTGNKGAAENPDATMVQLVSMGFTVVAPDCYEHGERRTEAWFRTQFNGWAFICEAMDRTRIEAPLLLKAVESIEGVSQMNPQVSGLSMGGLIAQMVFSDEPRYASMVSVVGRSSFFQADDWCRRAQVGTWGDEWCSAHATQSHPDRFTDRPVLFIDGGLDDDCPASVNAETVRLINAAGGRAEHFVDETVGHAFSQSMRAKFVAWMKLHTG